MPEIPREEQLSEILLGQTAEEAKSGWADVLALVDDDGVKRVGRRFCQLGINHGHGFLALRGQNLTQLPKHFPCLLATRFSEASFTAEAFEVTVLSPIIKIPTVDDIVPLVEQELRGQR